MSKRQIAVFWIKADGTIRKEVRTAIPKYEEQRQAVGGLIQQVPYLSKFVYHGVTYTRGTMWVNEEGRLRGLPFNAEATAQWRAQYQYATPLHGDAMFYATERAND